MQKLSACICGTGRARVVGVVALQRNDVPPVIKVYIYSI